MKRSIVHCYLIELEFVKDARKSLLEEYSMSAWRLVIPNIRTGYFHGETIYSCLCEPEPAPSNLAP